MTQTETIHALRRAGPFAEAAARCREWIGREPLNAEAAHLLGLLLSHFSQDFSHTYGNGGTTFDAAVTAFTDQGPMCADEFVDVAVTPGDPKHPTNPTGTVQNPPGDPNGNGSGGGGGGGGSEHTFWFNWCTPNPDGYTFLLDWGDGSPSTPVSTPSGSGTTNVTHSYGGDGQHWVEVTDDNGNVFGGGWVRYSAPPNPSFDQVPDKLASTGDAVDVSGTAHHLNSNSNEDYFGYVNWGDGTGLFQASSFAMGGTDASIAGHLDEAPDPGTYSGSFEIDHPKPTQWDDGHTAISPNVISGQFRLLVSDITLTIDNTPTDQKMDPGAFVPINDNYDSDEDVPDDQLPVPGIDDPQLVDASVQLGGPSGASVAWHLDFPSSVNVYESDGTTLTALVSGADSSPLTLSSSPTTIALKIEGVTADDNALLQAVLTPIAGQVNAKATTDQAKAAVHEFSMVPLTEQIDTSNPPNPTNVSGAELDMSDRNKRNAGAFVPVNNADEAYSLTTNQLGETTGVKLDKDMADANKAPIPIAGEDELLAIVLHTGNIAALPPSAIKFKVPGFLRVYQNPDRSGLIKSNTVVQMIHDGDYMFYVEGIAPGTGTIDLSEQVADNPAVPFKPVESLKVTAFNWTGALNAPQFGTYEYKVSNPTTNATNNPQGGQWLAPANGTMALHSVGGRPGANKSDVDITWGAGPVVGGAIYQASLDFTWRLPVNIVKVTVTNPTNGDPAFKAGTPLDGPVTGDAAHPLTQQKIVISGTPGLAWNAVVELSGPNGNHGVDLMKVGFAQNLKISAFSGTYGGAGFVRSARKIIGNTYWDTINRTERGESGGYADKRYSTNPKAIFDDASSAQGGALAQEISSRDTPQSGPPLYYFPGKRSLTSMSLLWDFRIYLTATTKENSNAAGNVYAAQAIADWSFNGAGTVGAGFIWTGPGVVTPPTAWAAPSGTPITTKLRANDILLNYWTQTGF